MRGGGGRERGVERDMLICLYGQIREIMMGV